MSQTPKETLTPEDARRVLKKNLENILKKVASGKTLSTAEQKLFEEYANREPAAEEQETKPEKRGRGRPRGSKAYYPNLKACAVAEGVTVEVLKLAKSLNCPGFEARGGVNWSEAGAWIAEHEAELKEKAKNSKSYWEIENLMWRAKRSKLAYEADDGLYYKKAEVNATLKNIGERQKTMLLSKFRNEISPRLEGLTAIQRIEVLEACALEICEIFNRGIIKYSK